MFVPEILGDAMSPISPTPPVSQLQAKLAGLPNPAGVVKISKVPDSQDPLPLCPPASPVQEIPPSQLEVPEPACIEVLSEDPAPAMTEEPLEEQGVLEEPAATSTMEGGTGEGLPTAALGDDRECVVVGGEGPAAQPERKSILEILAELKPKDLKSQVNKAAQEEHDVENASPAAADAQVPPALNAMVAKELAKEWAREMFEKFGPLLERIAAASEKQAQASETMAQIVQRKATVVTVHTQTRYRDHHQPSNKTKHREESQESSLKRKRKNEY